MNKAAVLKVTNILLFISAGVQAFTGIALFFHLFISKMEIFRGMIKVHEYNGMAFIVLVLAHVILNWGWVKTQLLTRKA